MNTVIETERLLLRILDSSYDTAVTDFLRRGRNLFEKYESAKTEFYYSELFQGNVLAGEYEAMLRKNYLRYYVFKKTNLDVIIGTVSFGNVNDSPYNNSTLGYKFDPFFHHRGYAFEAISAVLPEAMTYLNLHRVLAYIMPENTPSINLIEKLGFEREGLMKKAIKIKGQWEDHFLYALLNPKDNC